MSAREVQILQRLAVLVVCHGFAAGHVTSQYFLVQSPMSWLRAREFCQRHYVDLAVLNSEEKYYTLLDATSESKVSFWLGLRRRPIAPEWRWVSGEELGYQHWYRENYEGQCASLEAMLKNDKLLARHCTEQHMAVCQGPVTPQSVTVESAGVDHVALSWNVSAVMLQIPHSYDVTIRQSTGETHLLYPFANNSSVIRIRISDLTLTAEYFIKISAVVVRPDSVTGGNRTLRDNPVTLHIKTALFDLPDAILKLITFIYLFSLFCFLYCVLKKDEATETDQDVSRVEASALDTVFVQLPQRTRGFG